MTDTPLPAAKLAVPALMEVLIKGKLGRARKYESNFYTSVTIPSPDAYQRPSVVEVRSATRLGDADEIVTLRCKLSGYNGKPYQWTDKDTGESRQVVPVHNVLEAIQ